MDIIDSLIGLNFRVKVKDHWEFFYGKERHGERMLICGVYDEFGFLQNRLYGIVKHDLEKLDIVILEEPDAGIEFQTGEGWMR